MRHINETAISVARIMAASSNMKQKHGAVIMNFGDILSVGHNTLYEGHTSSQHAEINALVGATLRQVDIHGGTLYNVRLRSNGEFGLSTPCPECIFALRKHHIRRVFYSTDTGGFEEMLL